MLNLNSITKFLTTIAFISAFSACASTSKKETTGQYIDDSVITTRVKAAIFKEKALKTMQINVNTYKGMVQLSGFVDSSKDMAKAGDVAQGVDNVVSVKNDLIVK